MSAGGMTQAEGVTRGFLKTATAGGVAYRPRAGGESMFWTDQQNYQMNAGKHLHRPPYIIHMLK